MKQPRRSESFARQSARGVFMQIYQINSNLMAFYFKGDTEPDNPTLKNPPAEENWEITCDRLGVAGYVVYSGRSAIVYDTLCSPAQADEIKSYLEKDLGVAKFTVVLSHWHLDHVGGNALYAQSNIVASRKTRLSLAQHKAAIEAAALWGQPPVNPLRLPDIVFDDAMTIYLDDLEAQLLNFNIHSEDGVAVYLPAYKILLAGDMLEDTVSFVTNPEDSAVHIENYKRMREMDITRILPNHGRSAVIREGGYSKELIDSTIYYLTALREELRRDNDCVVADLKTVMAPYLDKGVVHYWEPYEDVHRDNVERVRAFIKSGRGSSRYGS